MRRKASINGSTSTKSNAKRLGLDGAVLERAVVALRAGDGFKVQFGHGGLGGVSLGAGCKPKAEPRRSVPRAATTAAQHSPVQISGHRCCRWRRQRTKLCRRNLALELRWRESEGMSSSSASSPIAAPLIAFWSYDEGETVLQPKEPPGTQIVVQWFDNSPPNSSVNADPLLDLLYMRSNDLYVVDSFDLGAGTMNVFLYTDDTDKAVRRVVELFEEGLLPQGMRIGVADTQGTEQSTRTYHPVYPPKPCGVQIDVSGSERLPNPLNPPAHPLPPQVAIALTSRAKRSPRAGARGMREGHGRTKRILRTVMLAGLSAGHSSASRSRRRRLRGSEAPPKFTFDGDVAEAAAPQQMDLRRHHRSRRRQG